MLVGLGVKKWLSAAYRMHAKLDLNPMTYLTNLCVLQWRPQYIS